MLPGGARSDKEVWAVATRGGCCCCTMRRYNAIVVSSPDFRRLLVGRTRWRGGLGFGDRRRGEPESADRTPCWLRFSPDGERFAASLSRRERLDRFGPSDDRANCWPRTSSTDSSAAFNWHPSGRWLAVPDHGSSVYWIDAQTGEKRLLGRHKAQATRAAFSPDGDYLISGGWDRELICWDARTLKRAFKSS